MSKSSPASGIVPLCYSIEGFGEALSLSKASVKRLIEKKYIRIVKLGARTLIPAGEGERLLQHAEFQTIRLRGEPPERGPRVGGLTPEMAAHITNLAAKRRARAKVKAEGRAKGAGVGR